MHVIKARNVNDAFAVGVNHLRVMGQTMPSRAGDVLVLPYPVTTTYTRPWERVLFNTARDANPFFHLLESLWMLAGRNDVEWISEFSSGIPKYSDDGVVFHGAYGHRWRQHFGFDQLQSVIEELRENPNSRRAVLGMWSPADDLHKEGVDFPCNLAVAFRAREGCDFPRLDMTVFNRSNDIIWGAYGANVVHMSILHEIVASHLQMMIGAYHQVSNDYHAYVEVLEKLGEVQPHPMCPYDMGQVRAVPMVEDPGTWFVDLENFMNVPGGGIYNNPFFGGVAWPMVSAWRLWKDKNFLGALQEISTIQAPDWRRACDEWLRRRYERYVQKDTGGRARTKVAHDTHD